MGHDLILNNEPEKATGPTQWNTTLIIDLTFTTLDIGALESWIIDIEFSTQSDHEMIVFQFGNLDESVGGMRTSQDVTGWRAKGLSKQAREKALVD